MKKDKSHMTTNIQILVYISDYKLVINIPKQTKVSEVQNIVRSYRKIHDEYGPPGYNFIGLSSLDQSELIDYWMTQMHLDFTRFKNKLILKALYCQSRKIQNLKVQDFQFLKCLGKGACGAVYLVRNKVTGYLFAMKRVTKDSVRSYNTLQNILREKKILMQLPPNRHTVNFHGSFQSTHHFNYLLDYCPGGDMFKHLSQRRLSQQQAKIYFCQIIQAMEFLHLNRILYRDLKPENILIDMDGHLRISDFGLSKCGFTQDLSAQSRVGSEQYMAPQIIVNQKYSFAVDFYSLGAILFELLTTLPPYYNRGNQNYEQKLQMIYKMDLEFDQISNPYAKQLVKDLLNPIPQKRITNFQQIRKNLWFSDIDWIQIENKSIANLPFTPNVYGNYICQQFLDSQSELDYMNNFQDDKFQPLFEFFNFIRPESQGILLGVEKKIPKQKQSSKRKPFIKQKNKSVTTTSTRSKGNISITLFDRDRQQSSSSNNSNVFQQPQTVKHSNNISNKQNSSQLKKTFSKNLMKIDKVYSHQPVNHHTSTNRIMTRNTLQSQQISYSSHKIQSTSKEKKLTLISQGLQQREKRQKQKSKLKSTSQLKGKSRSKEKSVTKPSKKQLPKLKKQSLPVSSYKIKLI